MLGNPHTAETDGLADTAREQPPVEAMTFRATLENDQLGKALFAKAARRSSIAWYGMLAVFLLLFYLFTFLAPLMSDDYNYAFSFDTGERITQWNQLIPSMVAHYRVSNGRVVTHFFASLMLWLGKPVFNIANAFVAVGLLLGLCRLTAGRGQNTRQLAMMGSALIVLLPTLGQVIFWLVGACNYLWGSALIIWALVPFRDFALGEYRRPAWWTLVLILPCYLLMGGTSENSSAAAILLMGLCCLYSLIRCRKVPAWFWAAIGLSVAGFLFMIFSPASLWRNAHSLSKSASLLGRYLVPFTNSATMFLDHGLAPSAVFAVLFSLAHRNGQAADRLALAIGLFLCGVAANFAMAVTGYYPARAMTGSLLLMMSASGILLPGLRLTRADGVLRGLEWALCLFALLLCIQAVPQTYDRYREAEARVERVTAARDAGQLAVSDTNISGKTKFDVFYDMIDLTDDPTYFSNAVFARYYGIQSVVAEVYR